MSSSVPADMAQHSLGLPCVGVAAVALAPSRLPQGLLRELLAAWGSLLRKRPCAPKSATLLRARPALEQLLSATFSKVPADLINLRLILVSGKTKEFLFSPNDSAADIAKHVYDNWPMDWEEEQVSSPNILRLIYQGRFLHGNVTLGALKLPFGKTTVMHLVARETLPEPNSQGQRNREKTGESNCCVIL
nr:PREDICTED: ubiquitin-like protein 3 [Balearica regulorum gibbericeps]